MIEIVFSPSWFYGKDILIDLCSIFVLFLIGFFSLSYYRITAKKTYLYLSLSFFLISLSFIFKILTNFTIYYHVLETQQIGILSYTYQIIKSSDALYFIGSLLHRILMLIGLYALYSIYHKQPKSSMILMIFLIIISTYFSHSSYYIFHLISLFLLALISKIYLDNYHKNKNLTTKLLAGSFAVITMSHVVFCFIRLNPILYVIAELIQLVGYILLLITFIMVLRDGKKKK